MTYYRVWYELCPRLPLRSAADAAKKKKTAGPKAPLEERQEILALGPRPDRGKVSGRRNSVTSGTPVLPWKGSSEIGK